MGWAQRAKEKTMGKPMIISRTDMAVRWARAVQHVAGAAAATLILTWGDETDTEINGDTACATQYGETSRGRHISSLPGETSFQVALGHLSEGQRMLAEQEKHMRERKDNIDKELAERAEREARERLDALQASLREEAQHRDVQETLHSHVGDPEHVEEEPPAPEPAPPELEEPLLVPVEDEEDKPDGHE